MRAIFLVVAVWLAGCGSAPPPQPEVKRDPTTEPWYAKTVADLAGLNRQATALFGRGKSDEAAALMKQAEILSGRLLSVRNPTIEAAEAASDLDQLYGRMLLSNRHYAWARLQFQKNVARWKHWRPQTTDTVTRLKQAEDDIAECDRKMSQ